MAEGMSGDGMAVGDDGAIGDGVNVGVDRLFLAAIFWSFSLSSLRISSISDKYFILSSCNFAALSLSCFDLPVSMDMVALRDSSFVLYTATLFIYFDRQ